jgi:site-specific recombinase XerD
MKKLPKSDTPEIFGDAIKYFFNEYLLKLKEFSINTQKSYRDTFALLIRFLISQHYSISDLSLSDITPDIISDFLDYLTTVRKNKAVTRNIRLAAIHSFFKYVAGRYPNHFDICQKVISIPFSRAMEREIEYLEVNEIEGILNSINRTHALGRRDYALLTLMYNTGARVQEVLNVRPCDLKLSKFSSVKIIGKGNKERICTLWNSTALLLKNLIEENNLEKNSTNYIFVNCRSEQLSRFGVRYILNKYYELASKVIPSLRSKKVHPHIFRHSTAMHMIQSKASIVDVGHVLGHASITTTSLYIKADLESKRKALEKIEKPSSGMKSELFRKDDDELIKWLEKL